MPRIIDQPADLGALPSLNDEKKAAAKIKVGHNKWVEYGDEIEHILIGHRRFYTDQALLDFLRRQTHKPVTAAAEPAPRKRVPPKPLPPAKGRRKAERRPSA